MEIKHTKGKWRISQVKDNIYIAATPEIGKGVFIAKMEAPASPTEKANSVILKDKSQNKRIAEELVFNAKLIAAAPELLEALIELENDSQIWSYIGELHRIRIINAIKKATE
jgi:hypothetical protein